jgi:hypothetical protein
MPRQNRVTPLSELVADPARGLVYGNRGCLHDANGTIVRRFGVKRWIACQLRFKDWQRGPLLQPGKFTELFFLDEATAFAAGHRPCALCRRADYNRFLSLVGASGADDELPDGAFVLRDGEPWLVRGDALLQWGAAGYTERSQRSGRTRVITPPTFLEVLRSDWQPLVPLFHPSAD